MRPEMTASRLSRAEPVREKQIKLGGLFRVLRRCQGRGGHKRPWRIRQRAHADSKAAGRPRAGQGARAGMALAEAAR